MTRAIQNLTKVVVALRAGNDSDSFNFTPTPVDFDFIYGAGSAGFCTFESSLYEKSEGDKITLTVPAAKASETFGHLRMPLYCALGLKGLSDTLFLEITVTGINEVDNRELVQSIAKGASHGCGGGSCDCGC